MSNILDKICADKKLHVESLKKEKSEQELLDGLESVSPPRGFHKALQEKANNKQAGLIAEIKKASPSRKVIRENFDPVDIAIEYERARAICLSVLTDEPYFKGKNEYLIAAREAVSLPVLRKDFIVDLYQVYESRSIGADCILLIMVAVNDDLAAEIEEKATDLGMDVLIEVHDEQELERALKLKSKLIGINNRNLKTLEVDIVNSEELSSLIPEGYTLVSESGIKTNQDIQRLMSHNIHCFLVGESLLVQDDVGAAVKKLIG